MMGHGEINMHPFSRIGAILLALPAVAGGRLYLRTETQLFSIEGKP